MDTLSALLGVEAIKKIVPALPEQPGIYRMMGADGNALYVGKAKNIKKRVQSYAQAERHTERIARMIAQVAAMDFTTTHTEAEALLLEANLIKKLKPRYNILLRDDKSFPGIHITGHAFPQVVKHRGARDKKGEYFGPFASTTAVNETLALLQRAFLLRNCSDAVFSARTRPCLQYQIRRCTAPCVGNVTQDAYAAQVKLARDFLAGKNRDIQDIFSRAMQEASDRQDYETAALFRDRIRALTHIQSHQTVHIDRLHDSDIFAISQDGAGSCVQVFFFRGGQNFGNRAYFPRHATEDSATDILSAFVAQFYAARTAPDNILVNAALAETDLLEEALKSKILFPQRGVKKELIEMAEKNAHDALRRKRALEAQWSESLAVLAARLKLPAPPRRIEVFDNSHISGTHALGAMIVAGPDGFQKNAYRKFNMDGGVTPGDDVGMMRALIRRRFQQADILPDLILIDGGATQLAAAQQSLAECGVDSLPLIAIAKGPERNAGREQFFTPGHAPFRLPPDDPALYFLQRLRDEAHRFAITSHRAKRSKAIASNPLDEVPGIGGKRKKALLLHFGSAKAVAEAAVADLQKVDGISRAMAEKIYRFFHEG